MTRPHAYGALLRKRRTEARLSLREVAEALGVSHVYLADVERGARNPLGTEHEHKLKELMPKLSMKELAKAREASKPIKITLSNTPEKYVDLTIALARRYERENLSETAVHKILALLKEDSDD